MFEFNQMKTTDSGDYDKQEVDQYLDGLMSDFARVRSAMQRNVDSAKADRQAAVDEMNSLRDKLDESEAERSQLESMLSDMKESVSSAKETNTGYDGNTTDGLSDNKSEQEDKEHEKSVNNDSDASETSMLEPYYNTSLMTGSGFELLEMLRAISGGMKENDNSAVMLTKSWEEEESVADPDDKEGKFVKTIKRKTEISVKYVPGGGRTE